MALNTVQRAQRDRGCATLISWHRGGSETHASASRAAFREAAEENADSLEVDVRRSADGVLLCVHDPDVPALGRVRDLVFDALTVDQQSEILTYADFLSDLNERDPEGRCLIHLDLKDVGYELVAVDATIAARRPFFVTTSEQPSISLLRRERPDYDAFLTIGSSSAGLSTFATLRLRTSELLPFRALRRTDATGVAVHYQLLTPLLRWWCRRHHLATVVWTVDNDEMIATWLERGVDVLTTNRPRRARGMREQR